MSVGAKYALGKNGFVMVKKIAKMVVMSPWNFVDHINVNLTSLGVPTGPKLDHFAWTSSDMFATVLPSATMDQTKALNPALTKSV